MIKNKFSRDFSRRVHSAGWSKFFSLLEYKAVNAGINVQKVQSFWTSQICAYCLSPSPKGLATRNHYCKICGVEEDRDIMSAKVIKISGVNPEKLSVPKAWLEAATKVAAS